MAGPPMSVLTFRWHIVSS